MNVLVTGATGWIGSAVVADLLEAGHRLTALIRSRDDGRELQRQGVVPVVGLLADAELLETTAAAVDGVIHTAMGSGLRRGDAVRDDVAAIEAFGRAYEASDRPIVVTHGLGALTAGTPFTEGDRPPVIAAYPRASEQTAFALAERGIRASVVRPARSVHGPGERHGFVPLLAEIARKKGVSAYVGDGGALWPACHRLDVARIYRLALERGAAGEAYHAVAEGVLFRTVAEAIGRQLGLPVVSITPDAAADHFGDVAMWVVGRDPVSTDLTRERLGWEPREIGLLADIDRPEYFTNGERHED